MWRKKTQFKALFLTGLFGLALMFSAVLLKTAQAVDLPRDNLGEKFYNIPFYPDLEAPTVGAHNVIVYDVGSDTVIYAKRPHDRLFPASTEKLMTAYLVFELLEKKIIRLEDAVTVSQNAYRNGRFGTNNSSMFLKIGQSVSIDDLLSGMIIVSGDDAATALAEHTYGSIEAFVEKMNEKANQLGMQDSHFKNPSGLWDPDQYMSAYDLAILSADLIKRFPQYMHYFSEKSFFFNNVKQYNRNGLLFSMEKEAFGMKTGYIRQAGYNIVGAARKDGNTFLVVACQMTSPHQRNITAQVLLRWAFNTFRTIQLKKAGEALAKLDTYGAWFDLPVYTKKDISVFLRQHEKTQNIRLEIRYLYPLQAPLEKDQLVGDINVYVGGQLRKSYPLYAKEDKEEKWWIFRLYDYTKYHVQTAWSRFHVQ